MSVSDIVTTLCAVLICMTLHEFAHGFVAYKLGDTTAAEDGRLTLNPFKHVDIIGLLCMFFFKFGWAKAVWCDPSKFKNPTKGMALVAAAGPIANLLTAILCIIITQTMDFGLAFNPNPFFASMSDFFWQLSIYSVALGLFNLIPLPPLDGAKIIRPILPEKLQDASDRFERYGSLVLFIIVYTGIMDVPFSWVYGKCIQGLYNACGAVLNAVFIPFI